MMQIADSSNVRAVGYDLARATLRVEFHTDGVYEYPEVSPIVFADMVSADSVGGWIHKNLVRPKEKCQRLDDAPKPPPLELRLRTALQLIASNEPSCPRCESMVGAAKAALA